MSATPFTIPTAKIAPTRVNPRRLLMYGPPKVGKTTAAAALEGHLIFELEDGNADYVEARRVDVRNTSEMLRWCEAGKQERQKGVKIRAIIDTLDKLEEWCEGDATDEYKKTLLGKNFAGPSVLDLPKGAGYNMLRMSFRGLLDIIEESFDEVIYICHLREKFLGEPGKEVASKDINLTGKCRLIACSRVNAIASLSRDKASNLIADFRTSETIVCGGHCPHLKGKQIVLGEADPVTGATTFHWNRIYLPEGTTPPAGGA
jgi:DNA polymerase III delta prime subunit